MEQPIQRLWIVTELFPPDETSTSYILGEIANAMAKKYCVGVICGPEIYDKRKALDINNKFNLDEKYRGTSSKGSRLGQKYNERQNPLISANEPKNDSSS